MRVEDAVQELAQLDERLQAAEANMERFTSYEDILGVQEAASYETMIDAREQLNLRFHMWRGIKEFGQLTKEWSGIPFRDIDAKKIAAQTDQYVRVVLKCKKNLAENRVINLLADPVLAYKATMPVVTALRSKFLTEEHWAEIKTILKKSDFNIDDEAFTLQKLLDLRVGDY
jgi:dynein heavy chain